MNNSITCPECGMTSYNLNDIRFGYCGKCHAFTTEVPEDNFKIGCSSQHAFEELIAFLRKSKTKQNQLKGK